jgi:hypothetical protein
VVHVEALGLVQCARRCDESAGAWRKGEKGEECISIECIKKDVYQRVMGERGERQYERRR